MHGAWCKVRVAGLHGALCCQESNKSLQAIVNAVWATIANTQDTWAELSVEAMIPNSDVGEFASTVAKITVR